MKKILPDGLFDSVQKIQQITMPYQSITEGLTKIASLATLPESIVSSIALNNRLKETMPFAGSTVYNVSNLVGLNDYLYSKQFTEVINLAKSASLFAAPSLSQIPDILTQFSLPNYIDSKSKDFGLIFSNFNSLIKNFPDKDNFEDEEDVLSLINQDSGLKKAKENLILSATSILNTRDTLTEETVKSVEALIADFMFLVAGKLGINITKQQTLIFAFVFLTLSVLAVDKGYDLLNNDTELIISNQNRNTEIIRNDIQETNTYPREIDLITSETFLYTKMSSKSKKGVLLSPQTEIEIIDFKEMWCYIKILDHPDQKGWVKNKTIERFK